MLPTEIFEVRKSKTRDPKRKFAAKEYFMEIGRYTKITDLKTLKIMNLEDAVNKFGIIDVQLLDFAGSVFLDNNNWNLQSGFNRLFVNNGVGNASQLLGHKVRLSRYLRNFHHQEAMKEMEQILKFGEQETDKFVKFKYICLIARIKMRQRNLISAKTHFEDAITLLDNEFSKDEREKLILERKARMKYGFNLPNWDTELVDYDEIFVNMLYTTLFQWMDETNFTNQLISILNETLNMAEHYNLYYDIIFIREHLATVYKKLGNLDLTEIHLVKAIEVMDLNNLEQFDPFNYGAFHISLAGVYMNKQRHLLIQEIIDKLQEKINLGGKDSLRFAHYKSSIMILSANNERKKAFKVTKEFVDEIIKNVEIYRGISPLFFVKEIYHFISLGIELDEFDKIQEIDKYVTYMNSLVKDFPVVSIYKEMIDIRFQMEKLWKEKYEIQDFDRVDKSLENILKRTESDILRFIHVIVLYYYFLSKNLKENVEIKNKLLNLTERVSEILLDSPYTMITIKNQVIKEILLGNIDKIESILIELQTDQQIFEISDLLDLIKDFSDHDSNLENFIYQLISNDMFYSIFETQTQLSIKALLEN